MIYLLEIPVRAFAVHSKFSRFTLCKQLWSIGKTAVQEGVKQVLQAWLGNSDVNTVLIY